jgi:hypothetical protein
MTKIAADQIHAFASGDGRSAIDLAKRMSRFGRKQWIVWWLADGSYKAAKLSRESLEACMAEAVGSEAKPGLFYAYHAGTGSGENVRPFLAKIWHKNMVAGHFQF